MREMRRLRIIYGVHAKLVHALDAKKLVTDIGLQVDLLLTGLLGNQTGDFRGIERAPR